MIVYASVPWDGIQHVDYAWSALTHSLDLGETPISLALLYAPVLTFADGGEQAKLVAAISKATRAAKSLAVYADRGLTPSMVTEIRLSSHLPITIRHLTGNISRCTQRKYSKQCELKAGHQGPHLSSGPDLIRHLWT